ncbi:hypothetical protein B0H63DRAFT_536302 [Podospora didyma]|uniref:BZIP domain-containing protein n=1 Tax=Podospora didyma TaxID=330526 RepID=A0AAE0JYJ4_9PEZI|nr:hypothetical protein B0H63DRAFT_536302 [Podospora didyma]
MRVPRTAPAQHQGASSGIKRRKLETKHASDTSPPGTPKPLPSPAGSTALAFSASREGTPSGQRVTARIAQKAYFFSQSDEGKQRNRQAQAAFRERRTVYIKQLEEAIRTHEQNLVNLQAAHRHAADECLMLRYKNSLLERILLEKGIDVQSELRAKIDSHNLRPTHMPHNMVQPPPIQRALLKRHHSRRSNSSIAPKLEPGSRPTPSSHSASPIATASFGSQHGAAPAGSDHMTTMRQPRQTR